jgi:hypothetical protein
MKHIKLFIEESDYNNYIYSDNAVFPNVSLIFSTDDVRYNEEQPINANVGDVAYWDGSKIKTVALADYSDSMGQAIGVVVIPSNFLPDGKARMVALNQENEDKFWGTYKVDTSLPNYKSVPVCNNNGASVEFEDDYGYLPSDLFFNNTGSNESCVTDSVVMYRSSEMYIPSPYKETENGLILNQDFIKTLPNGNALSDFNGKENTSVLVGLGSDFEAAIHAKNYSDGVSNAEWYLPAMGELGVMMARLGTINDTISTLGGVTLPTNDCVYSSTECDLSYAHGIDTYGGSVGGGDTKDVAKYPVRSFACL